MKVLFNTKRQLNEIDFDGRGAVSDMCPTNTKLWNELDSSIEKLYFLHPKSETQRLNIFADVPHLLKLKLNYFFIGKTRYTL